MTSTNDHLEEGLGGGGLNPNPNLDDKVQSEHIDEGKGIFNPAAESKMPERIFEAPESVRNMTPEQREAAEAKLRRKIDMRLMPMIILMYVFLKQLLFTRGTVRFRWKDFMLT
jgi:hypothetical protein